MRWTLALLLALTTPTAGAVGVTSVSLAVTVDAPLLAPVSFTTPSPREAVEATSSTSSSPVAASAPPPPPSAPVALDMETHAPVVEVDVTPPRVMTASVAPGKLARMDAAGAPPAPRAPRAAPRALDDAPQPRAPALDEASGARVLSPSPASAPARADAPAAPRAPAPPAGEPPAGWPALATAGLVLLLLPTALALYHRLRGPALAASGVRREILALLARRPGASASEVARAMGLDPSTALYHLRRLAREGLIVTDGAPRAPRYFAVGAHAPHERARILAERSGADVLAAIRAAPGSDKSGLARRLAISRAAVAWHLASLQRVGLVRYERAGRSVLVYPTTF